jgi:2-(3-amino-3-carboxypropyl)histidine synthase
MQNKSINEISEIYELEIERIVKTIKHEKAKKVLLQFPEGMKPYSTVICDEITDKTRSECFIWLGTCFGACDVPIEVEKLGVDLIIQFGHSDWNYDKKKGVKVLK